MLSNPSRPHVSSEASILLLTSMGHVLCHISELAFFGLLTAVVADEALNLTIDQATFLPVPGFVLYGIGALPTGMLTDRYGSRPALSLYFLVVGLSCLVIYHAGDALQLCLGLTLLGAAISIYHPASLAMLSLGCARRGRAMGINGVAGSLGVATGPALGLLVLTAYSWRVTYLIIAGLAVAGLVGSVALRIQLPEVERASPRARSTRGGSLVLLALLFAAMLVGGFNYRCLTTVLPAYLSGKADEVASGERSVRSDAVTTGGFEEGTGSASELPRSTPPVRRKVKASTKGVGLVFLVFALGGLGQLAGGFLADRYPPALLYALAILTTAPLALAIARVPVLQGAWLAGALAIFMFAEQPFENTLIAEATPARYRSTMYGLKFVLAFGLASLGAYVAGLTWRYAGLARVFDMFAAGAMLMGSLAVGVAWIARHRGTEGEMDSEVA